MQDLLMFYQTKKTEKNIAELLARKLAKERQGSSGKDEQRSPVIDLSPTNLPLLVNLENLSSSVKEIDLFGLDAFAWYKAEASHYVQANENFSLAIRLDKEERGYFLYAVFPKTGFYAPLLDDSADFDLAYGCANAYLFDYGDRYLAAKAPHWRKQEPSVEQRRLFERLRSELKVLSHGLVRFPKPKESKGDYSGAITALNVEKVMLTGKRMGPEKAKEFIKENVHARVIDSETILLTSKSNADATIEAALRRAIAIFSKSEDGDFLGYLKKILLENEILLDGNFVKVSHVKFPRQMTEKQLRAVKDRIQEEIRLYAPDADVVFSEFPVVARPADS
jgi:hypothetical protein